MAKKQVLNPPTLSKPTGYSHIARKGNTVYIAGQVAVNAQGQLVGPGNISVQVEQVFSNIKAALEAVGGTMDDILKITMFTTNIAYLPAIREVRNRYFSADSLPASTLVMISSLANPDFMIEIEAIAEVG